MAVGLQGSDLIFEFPDIHPDAVLRIGFHRTLRIPDDDGTYNLPPSLGRFRPKDVGPRGQTRGEEFSLERCLAV